RYYGPLGLPPGSARLQPSGLIRSVFARPGCRGGLSCSALLCPDVPPPATPERSSIPSVPRCCLLPSPRNDRLGPPKHLSADYLTRLLRSLIVAARRLAPLSFKGF